MYFKLIIRSMLITTYVRDTQKHIFSVHNLGGVPLIYATVSSYFYISYQFQ
jgi:hypothetical protein